MRSLEDILKDLNDAEKEYQNKCQEYGISETSKKKKEDTASNQTNI